MAARLGRLAGADEEVGADAVGDEGLGAVDDVAAGGAARRGGDRGDVGARARLGDPQRADLLALDPRHHPPLPLLLVAEVEDRRQGDRGVRVEARGDASRAPRPRQLLDPHRVVQVVAALAAVALRELQAEEAELGAAAVEVTGEFPRRLPLVDVRRHLGGDETLDRPAQLLVLLTERRQHRPHAAVLDHARTRSSQAIAAARRRRPVRPPVSIRPMPANATPRVGLGLPPPAARRAHHEAPPDRLRRRRDCRDRARLPRPRDEPPARRRHPAQGHPRGCAGVATPRGSFCEFKGAARYFDGEKRRRQARPRTRRGPTRTRRRPSRSIRDHVAFYQAGWTPAPSTASWSSPQPGGFYGGWISSEVAGPFKGGPGTLGW